MLDFDILTTTRSWGATPWDYNSCIFLRFRTDGSGDMVFGYGQTIYAKVNFRFSINTPNELEFIYQDSPGDRFVKSFTPSESRRSKTVHYSLKEREVAGVDPYGDPFKYYWTLSLDKPPFPDELTLPHMPFRGDLIPPDQYYGHNQNEKQGKDEQEQDEEKDSDDDEQEQQQHQDSDSDEQEQVEEISDEVTERNLPAGASRLNKTWLRWTGKDRWSSTTATVYSCEFTTRQERDIPVGYYHVVISYGVEGKTFTGKFVDFGTQAEEYFRRGDTLEIRYNPKDPSKFYYPDLRTQTRFSFTFGAIGAILAIIVMLIRIMASC